MKKRMLFWLVIVMAMILTACSTVHDSKQSGAPVSEGTQGVETSGVGSDEDFSDVGGRKSATLKVENQTYYFAFDRSDIYPDDRESVAVQAHYLISHPTARVRLEGHTDPRGSREYNIALGERRAKSVAALLKLEGVSSEQIRIVSYGAEKLALPGHTEEDYELDRRVNLVYEAK